MPVLPKAHMRQYRTPLIADHTEPYAVLAVNLVSRHH